jgi:hypothetical protein
MRTLALLTTLCLCSSAHAQTTTAGALNYFYASQAGYSPYYAPVYYAPAYYAPVYRDYVYENDVREMGQAVEYGNFQRRWSAYRPNWRRP